MIVSKIRKAIVATVFAAAAAIGGCMLDGQLTGPELVYALGTALTTGAATYTVRNARDDA